MKENEEFLVDGQRYALGYGGASVVPPELGKVMQQNSEAISGVLAKNGDATRKSLYSDSPQPIGG